MGMAVVSEAWNADSIKWKDDLCGIILHPSSAHPAPSRAEHGSSAPSCRWPLRFCCLRDSHQFMAQSMGHSTPASSGPAIKSGLGDVRDITLAESMELEVLGLFINLILRRLL
jgi:hypothetical protein